METVLLKSRVGPVQFTRRTKIVHERGITYDVKDYSFNFSNDFKMAVSKDVWESLEDEWLDKTLGHTLKYKDALIEL